MSKRDRRTINYPSNGDDITWGEYDHQYDGQIPVFSEDTKVRRDRPSAFNIYLLKNRKKIEDARLAESDEQSTCHLCSKTIEVNENHVRIRLEDTTDTITICNHCFG